MNKIDKNSIVKDRLSSIDDHSHICDLAYLDGPILSLFRDSKQDWLYLWCDTDNVSTERWLLFTISRSDFVNFIDGESTLRSLLLSTKTLLLLDHSSISDERFRERRILRKILHVDAVKKYWPSNDSYFDDSLTTDISTIEQLKPEPFEIPIDGSWFFSDLDKFSRVYSQLYAFFYCTGERFVTNIEGRLKQRLRAPWIGGGSRVNLFRSLKNFIPAVHDLKINSFNYASPGQIRIEALKSVGIGIAESVQAFIDNEENITKSIKIINTALDQSNLRTKNLSQINDDNLPLNDSAISEVKFSILTIVTILNIADQYSALSDASPNLIVSSKVLLALIKRISLVADFQKAELINGTKWASNNSAKI